MGSDTVNSRSSGGTFPRYSSGVTAYDNGTLAMPPGLMPKRPFVPRDDETLTAAAEAALVRDGSIPADRFTVRVADGIVTLEGCTECHYQRANVEQAVRFLDGVRDVVNRIVVTPPVSVADVRLQILDALTHAAEVAAARIDVRADGSTVTLHGTVRSNEERIAVEREVRRLPGVAKVNSDLLVGPS